MNDNNETKNVQELFKPNPDLLTLNPLLGTWKLSGDSSGQVKYELMEGGFFLIQHFNITVFGNSVKGVEVIGHLKPFGAEPDSVIRSRAYDSLGNTLDYVYEIINNTLFIWAGEKNSPAYFRGIFNEGGDVNEGEWIYPDGGYKSIMKRIKY